jgi:hypothetical protein
MWGLSMQADKEPLDSFQRVWNPASPVNEGESEIGSNAAWPTRMKSGTEFSSCLRP